ncbi:MAG: CRISPR-associated CARF protein Csx1 [Candidatus Methanomethyliaceae archaeon]|nr:CRISPR-associated CARF protein Csx1 [Candidatus Methanomethyliaceae archaeon]MDW7971450.1 CRISPR-associated CARF protein Csx1 [Nitrososphaerota archaeon]
MKSILIITLGDPSFYDEVEYIYENSHYKSKFTLPLLFENTKPEYVIIIALDTIIDEPVGNYNELINSVNRKYRDFISKEIPNLDKLKIIVAPGVGRFQSKNFIFNFIGELRDFLIYLIYELSKIFIESEDGLTIHLDLTHGINFMPTFTLHAIKEIAGLLTVAKENVRLRVYNAEPYRRNITSSLRIHIVEDWNAILEYDLTAIKRGRLLKLYDKKLNKEMKEPLKSTELDGITADDINVFISSIFNGLPLSLYTFYPNVSKLEEIINKVIETWRSFVNISMKDNELYIKRLLTFHRNFIRIIHAWFMAKLLNLERKSEVSLEEIDMLRRLFSRWSKRIDAMISYDLYHIKEKIANKELKEWTKLYIALDRSPKGFDTRAFLAHSSLEMNVTEIKKINSKLIFRYIDDEEYRDRIIKACLSGLT